MNEDSSNYLVDTRCYRNDYAGRRSGDPHDQHDRYGHIEGNRVLRAVGNGLKSACRKHDYVARMGGDEFVLLLPRTNDEELDRKIEAMRAHETQEPDYSAWIGARSMWSISE